MAERLAPAAPDAVAGLVANCLGGLSLDVDAVELLGSGGDRVLRVVVDRDGGVPVDMITQVSRELSGALDRSDVMGESTYTLEVTSRGVTRPLTLARHWQRNVGRLVKVKLTDGQRIRGRISDADDERVSLDDGSRVPYVEVAEAVIQPELKKER